MQRFFETDRPQRTAAQWTAMLILCGLLAGCHHGQWSRSLDGWAELFLHEAENTNAASGLTSQLAKARSLESAGKQEEARRVYQQLLVEYPDRSEPYHRLAVVADHQRRHREAQSLYAQAIRIAPARAGLFSDLGYSFFLDGQLNKAESALRKAVALAPAEPRHHNNLGLVLGHQDRLEEALAEFRLAGSEADAQYNLAFVHSTRDRAEQARECFHRALASDPTHQKTLHALKAFDHYDAHPGDGAGQAVVAGGRSRWIPYVEDAAETDTATFTSTESASPALRRGSPPATSPDLPSRQQQIRATLSQRLGH